MTYVSTILATSGIIGFWELAEASGTNAADATSTQAGTYTNTGGIALGQTGIIGGGGATAAKFTPGTGYVAVADNASQHVTNTFSVEYWVKVGATGAAYSHFSSPTANSLIIETSSANPPILICSQVAVGTAVTTTTGIPVDSAFHHVVWARAGSATDKLYLDGADITGTVTARNMTTATATGYNIARKGNTSNEYTNGTIAMVALYNAQLSGATVSAHYTAGTTGGATSINQPGFRFGFM